MRKPLLFLLLLTAAYGHAQPYLPSWESLDKRPVPKWFTDAKFGIFIHWGVYSVPAYTTKGNYAEWYQHSLQGGDSATTAYHHARFGDLTYYQLAGQFKAELFNPDEWANLFERSGARYIVLTSKHHDGFALWPSKDADRSWGFPWNAADTGPKRDLLGDLFKAVRKTPVHAGMYYSLYEWYNPLWKKDKAVFAADHTWPQMKDLINTYRPDVFWTDGDWDASEEVWKSKEFLAWLYNESPVKEKVVTYDRWGAGLRFKHGSVYTPEYQPDLDFEDHAWEESRGMGYSYGYNREEDAWDYNSAQSLVYHLVDKVSRGGNFLLDIGPDEHGKIPPIMQERLLQIGDWLKVNGEAIYGTIRWKKTCQWSEGRRDYKAKKGEDIMLRLTVNPAPGYATKEIFYTYNATTDALYAIFPQYPSGKKLLLKDVALQGIHDVNLLSTGAKLQTERQGNDLLVRLPDYDPNQSRSPYAYVVRISGYGAFAAKPKITVQYDAVQPQAAVSIAAPAGAVYSVNGGTPKTYAHPLFITKNTIVRSFVPKTTLLLASDTAEAIISGLDLFKAVPAHSPAPGIAYGYYEADPMNMAVFTTAPASFNGITRQFSLTVKQRKEKFGLVFEGYIRIDEPGGYIFYTKSDDGSLLLVDGMPAVNNDGNHGFEEKEGRCFLEKGYHKIKLQYFDSGGDNNLLVSWQPPGQNKTVLPASVLFH